MWPMIDVLKIDPTFRTEKSALRAMPQNRELNEIFEQLVDDINIEKKELSRKLKVNISSIHNWCAHGGHIEKHPIPIWVLNWMIETSKNNEIRTRVNKLIEAIRCGRTGTVQRFPRHLTPEISSIIGAHAADGSLSKIPKRPSLTWELADQHRESVELASNWIEKTFGLRLEVNKCRNANAWHIVTRIQIFPRFLANICDMPIGPKSKIVKEPSILRFPFTDERLITKPTKNQKRKLELSFAKSVMIFDGHCCVTGNVPVVGIGLKSNDLLSDLLRIFDSFKINFHDFIRHERITTTSRVETTKFFKLNGFMNTPKQDKLRGLLSS